MSIDVMKQALAALEQYTNVVTSVNDPNSWVTVADGGKPARDAITALRAAIEQAEKPWVKTYAGGKPNYTEPVDAVDINQERVDGTAKREHEQKEWVGLTEDEMRGLYQMATYMDETDYIHMLMMAEAKLKERNNA